MVFSQSSGWFGAREPPASGALCVYRCSVVRLSVIDPLWLAGLENLRAQAAKHATNVNRPLGECQFVFVDFPLSARRKILALQKAG